MKEGRKTMQIHNPEAAARFAIQKALEGDEVLLGSLLRLDESYRAQTPQAREYRAFWMKAARGLALTGEFSFRLTQAGASFSLIEALYGVI
jgi:hypothetical protein